jgi:hypothetical protein
VGQGQARGGEWKADSARADAELKVPTDFFLHFILFKEKSRDLFAGGPDPSTPPPCGPLPPRLPVGWLRWRAGAWAQHHVGA